LEGWWFDLFVVLFLYFAVVVSLGGSQIGFPCLTIQPDRSWFGNFLFFVSLLCRLWIIMGYASVLA
jgi:hypothetical protein